MRTRRTAKEEIEATNDTTAAIPFELNPEGDRSTTKRGVTIYRPSKPNRL